MKQCGQMWIREDDPFMGRYFEETGDKFEINHLEAALAHCTEMRTALDVGAHYGSWSRYMARKFRRVFAFEPIPTTFECCQQNVRDFANVSLKQAAVGDRSGKVSVGVGKMYSHPGMETIIDVDRGDTDLVTIDSLNLTDVDLIKVDVEGFELQVLKGAAETLARCQPVVIFEENVRGLLEHGTPNGLCGAFLKRMGARQIKKIGKDHIYSWHSPNWFRTALSKVAAKLV